MGVGVHTIRDSCYHRETGAGKTLGGNGSKHVKATINPQLKELHHLGSYLERPYYILHPGGGKQRRGPMPLGAFLVFSGGHLPQTSAWSKQYLPVIFVCLAFICQNFHERWCRNYWRFNRIKTPSMKARTKVLASFEASINSPNLPWHVNITSLKPQKPFRGSPLLSPS